MSGKSTRSVWTPHEPCKGKTGSVKKKCLETSVELGLEYTLDFRMWSIFLQRRICMKQISWHSHTSLYQNSKKYYWKNKFQFQYEYKKCFAPLWNRKLNQFGICHKIVYRAVGTTNFIVFIWTKKPTIFFWIPALASKTLKKWSKQKIKALKD